MVSALDCSAEGLPFQIQHSTCAAVTRLAIKRSVGVIPEVNLREHTSCMPPPSVNKVPHFGFETQRRHHQKSKIGVSVDP